MAYMFEDQRKEVSDRFIEEIITLYGQIKLEHFKKLKDSNSVEEYAKLISEGPCYKEVRKKEKEFRKWIKAGRPITCSK